MMLMEGKAFVGSVREDWLCVYLIFNIRECFFCLLCCRWVEKICENLYNFGSRLYVLLSSTYIFRHQPLEFIGKVFIALFTCKVYMGLCLIPSSKPFWEYLSSTLDWCSISSNNKHVVHMKIKVYLRLFDCCSHVHAWVVVQLTIYELLDMVVELLIPHF